MLRGWILCLSVPVGFLLGCNGPVTHVDGSTEATDADSASDTNAECEGIPYGEVCFTVVPLLLGNGSDPGRGVFHTFGQDPQPAVVGAVDDQLYFARFVADGVETLTTPIDVYASSTISIGDFGGDGQVRIVLRGNDSDSLHVVSDAGDLGSATVIPLDTTNQWSPAAAMDMTDGSSLLVSRAGALGTMQPYRLELDMWVPQGLPISAPDAVGWSFDVNGDGLRDVGLSSFPALLQPGDTIPGVRVDVLVSDGLGGFEQFEHQFNVPCGVNQFFPAQLTSDEVIDLACYSETSEWQESEVEPNIFAVYVAAGFGDGAFDAPQEVFLSMGPNARALRGFANIDGVGLPELLFADQGDPSRVGVVSPPWMAAGADFSFPVRVLDASDVNGDGIDDLVVHNEEGAYALLSN